MPTLPLRRRARGLICCAASAVEPIHQQTVVPIGPENPRNSEAAIIPLKDGSLLLAGRSFTRATARTTAGAPLRLISRMAAGPGEKYTLVENDGGRNVMEVNFLRSLDGEFTFSTARRTPKARTAA